MDLKIPVSGLFLARTLQVQSICKTLITREKVHAHIRFIQIWMSPETQISFYPSPPPPLAQQPNWGLDRLTVEVSVSLSLSRARARTHTHTHARARARTHTHTHTVGLLWRCAQLVAEAATYTTHSKHTGRTSIPSAGFQPAIPVTKQLQTYALDVMATGIGRQVYQSPFLWTG